jgi:hypothetical protein
MFRSSPFFGLSSYLTRTQSVSFVKTCHGKILNVKFHEILSIGSHAVSCSTDGQMWWCTYQLMRDLPMYVFQLWNNIRDLDEVWYLRVILKIEANLMVWFSPCNCYYTWISYQTSTAVSKSGKTEQACCSTFWITCGAQVKWQEGYVCHIQLPWHGRRILSVTVHNSNIIHTIKNQNVQPLDCRIDVIKT